MAEERIVGKQPFDAGFTPVVLESVMELEPEMLSEGRWIVKLRLTSHASEDLKAGDSVVLQSVMTVRKAAEMRDALDKLVDALGEYDVDYNNNTEEEDDAGD